MKLGQAPCKHQRHLPGGPAGPHTADQPLAVPLPPVLLSPPSCTTVPDIQWLKHWCRAAQLQGLVLSSQAAMVGVTPILE